MKLMLVNLLQPQQTRLSWVVIVAAALVLIAGVSLLVYFYRRYKRIEKETEDDWDASRSSLFVKMPREQRTDATDRPDSIETSVPVVDEAAVVRGGTREFASEIEVPSAAPPKTTPPQPIAEPIPSAPEAEAPIQRATELLASPLPAQPISEPEAPKGAESFDEEVWAGLEGGEQAAISAEHLAKSEPPHVARVESTSHRESFEPPKIERAQRREPYEPPRIEPLTPKEQAATRALHSMKPRQAEPPKQRSDRQTGLFGTSAAAGSEPDRKTLEFAAAPVAPSHPDVEPSIATRASYKSRLAPAGSVLGLPFEASSQPLILGKPVRPAEETGIGALTNYGKDLGPKGGRAGTVVLLLVIGLLAGAAAAYMFVPSVHSRTNALVSRIRGVDALNSEAALKPKAQIIPSFRPEVNKNMVIARGAVDNISEQPLENLEIEVSLQRGDDAPPDMRRVPVTPSPLPPNERGNFEFEYDGKRDTGFAGYKITRLFSNGNEVKFKSPTQK